MDGQPENLILNVLVRDRQGLIFEGEAESVSSFNDQGLFDVLPLHTNFISLISKEITLRVPGAPEKHLPVEKGVLKVRENKVEVYLGIVR